MNLSGQTILIGVGAPLSGTSAPLGCEMKQAIELAIEERNAGGGICGAKIEVRIADDASDPGKGEIIARDFCSTPGLIGVVGHFNSDVAIAASTIYHDRGLAMITPIASNPAVTEGGFSNVFRFTNRDDRTGLGISKYLFERLNKRHAVVIENTTMYGKSMAENFVEAFTFLGGQVMERRIFEAGANNFTAEVETLPENFDVLFYGGMLEGAFILKAMRAASLNQLFAAGDGCWDVPHFVEPAGHSATEGEGVLVLSASPEVGRVPGSAEFAQKYIRKHGPIINYAVNSYDSARVLLLAIENAIAANEKIPTRAGVINAMRELKFQGIAYRRPIQWDRKGDNLAAITALNIVASGHFRQIAEIGCEAEQTDPLGLLTASMSSLQQP
jgi:branched-chain amino acid transport system substrate-binding protein